MRTKVIGLILIMLMIPLILPATQATAPVETKRQIFANCYLEATGSIDFTFKLTDIPIGLRYRYISFWPIIFNEPSADVTIYSKKNGRTLWEDTADSGQWILYLVNFFGKYNNDGSTTGTLMANLEGRASFIFITPVKHHNTDATEKSSISATTISSDNSQPLLVEGRYRNCYLEISGFMHSDWPAFIKYPNLVRFFWVYDAGTTHVRNGLYSYILFEKNASIKVYDEKNGNLLWQHQGTTSPLLTLVGFSGDCIIDYPPHELPSIILNGDVRFLGIRLKHFLFHD
jgi:hypothetical protein